MFTGLWHIRWLQLTAKIRYLPVVMKRKLGFPPNIKYAEIFYNLEQKTFNIVPLYISNGPLKQISHTYPPVSRAESSEKISSILQKAFYESGWLDKNNPPYKPKESWAKRHRKHLLISAILKNNTIILAPMVRDNRGYEGRIGKEIEISISDSTNSIKDYLDNLINYINKEEQNE